MLLCDLLIFLQLNCVFVLTASQDLLKWAANEENRALQDVANQLAELNLVWTEVQRDFCGRSYSYFGLPILCSMIFV